MRVDPREQRLRLVASLAVNAMHEEIAELEPGLFDDEFAVVLSKISLDVTNTILSGAYKMRRAFAKQTRGETVEEP